VEGIFRESFCVFSKKCQKWPKNALFAREIMGGDHFYHIKKAENTPFFLTKTRVFGHFLNVKNIGKKKISHFLKTL
jgi:hypothetical protein